MFVKTFFNKGESAEFAGVPNPTLGITLLLQGILNMHVILDINIIA